MWVVRRTYDQLMQLAPDPRPAPHPDKSIVVSAMADYVRFTGKQIGMPTLSVVGPREYLRDGAQLLQALGLAGRKDEVFCLAVSDSNRAQPPGSERFDALCAQRTGSDARLLTFQSLPDAEQRALLQQAWGLPTRQASDSSLGWSEQDVASMPDWLTWLRALVELLPRLPHVLAINGRRPALPPARSDVSG